MGKVAAMDLLKDFPKHDLQSIMETKREPGPCRRVWGDELDHSDDYEPGGVDSLEVIRGRGPALLRTVPDNATAGKMWKFRRNIVIFVAHRDGIPQRVLADVFDLPKSRIASIIKEIKSMNSRD